MQNQTLDDRIMMEMLGIRNYSGPIINPLQQRTQYDIENPHRFILKLMRKPEYFYYTAKTLLGIELLPFQCVILEELWNRPFPMLIASRGAGKSFILGLYAVMRALFIQGRKIVITGSGFRQAKTVFRYCENIWDKSPMLRSLVSDNSNSGILHGSDRWVMKLGDSTIVALPLGDGTKIRGERANDIIGDEFACVGPKTIIDTPSGMYRIGELVGKRASLPLHAGDDRIESPTRFVRTPPVTTYVVKLRNGFAFKCSGKHKVLTKHGWKLGKDLVAGADSVKVQITDSFAKKDADGWGPARAWLWGAMLTRADVGTGDKTVCDFFDRETQAEAAFAAATNGLASRAYMVNSNFADYRVEFMTPCVHGLGVPSDILVSTKRTIKAFLQGVFDAGAKPNGNTKDGVSIQLPLKDEQLASDIHYLLAKLGIPASYSEYNAGAGFVVKVSSAWTHKLAKLVDWKYKHLTVAGKCSKQLRDGYSPVASVSELPEHEVLYDFVLPENKSFLGNGVLQHNSIPPDIYEEVVQGFASVNLDPVKEVKKEARIRVLKEMGQWTEEMEEARKRLDLGNQSIIAGTASFAFNHFCDYWRRWKGIIESRGDAERLREAIGAYPEPEFDWRHYSIIRLPVEKLPPGFMDSKQIAKSRATIHKGIFLNEYGAAFSSDSNGFFKRSLIESCVTKNPILVNGYPVQFSGVLHGNMHGKYIFGIDPASEHDRFSIVVVECHKDHRRVVHCWTTTRQEQKQRVKDTDGAEHDFYGYCARKIRELMKRFPCEHIALDSQGGGIAVREALQDPKRLLPGEYPIYEITADHPLSPEGSKPKDTDNLNGLHILEMVSFASAQWTADANHGMRQDFENKVLLFPMLDAPTLAVTAEDDEINKRRFDTLEDCVMEIEDLKEELATITHSQTPGSNRDKWDTPEIKLPGSKKGRLRKDRYSALLMANSAARRLTLQHETPEYKPTGGFVGKLAEPAKGDKLYVSGPAWFVSAMEGSKDVLGAAIYRGGVR